MGKMGVIFFLSSVLLMAVTIRAQHILDTEDNPVTKNEHYFIIDKDALDERGKSIGASHAPQTFAHACPRVVVVPYEERSSYYQVPVSFSPSNLSPGSSIYEGFNISIKYEFVKWPCPKENPVWTVNHGAVIHKSEISFGGKPNKLLTTFKIEKEGEGYKFTHYNTETKKTDVVGVLNAPELGYKRLILSSDQKPFTFVLQKAETVFKRSSIITMLPLYI